MNCPACGAAIKNPAQKFCNSCGAVMPPPVAPAAPAQDIVRPLSTPPPVPAAVGAGREGRTMVMPPEIPAQGAGQQALGYGQGFDRLGTANPWKCRQRILTIRDRYDVKDSAGSVLFTVVGKIISLHRKLAFFLPDKPDVIWLRLERIFRGVGEWFVPTFKLDLPNGQLIAVFKSNFLLSTFIYSKWHIFDANGNEIGHAQESSLWVALATRYFSRLLHGLTAFDIMLEDRQLAKYNRNFKIADTYTLEIMKNGLSDEEVCLLAGLVALLDKGENR